MLGSSGPSGLCCKEIDYTRRFATGSSALSGLCCKEIDYTRRGATGASGPSGLCGQEIGYTRRFVTGASPASPGTGLSLQFLGPPPAAGASGISALSLALPPNGIRAIRRLYVFASQKRQNPPQPASVPARFNTKLREYGRRLYLAECGGSAPVNFPVFRVCFRGKKLITYSILKTNLRFDIHGGAMIKREKISIYPDYRVGEVDKRLFGAFLEPIHHYEYGDI
jgi:hypothetical protein